MLNKKQLREQKISLVLPAFNEAESIPELYYKIIEVMKRENYNYEIIFVDDGSRDATSKIVEELREKNRKVKLITLQRNYGKATALQQGFNLASGDIIVTMDSDLQDDPEEIPKFVEKIKQGYDFVNGRKIKKWRGNFMLSMLSGFYNWLTRKITNVKVHDFNCPFKAYRAHIAKNLNLYGYLHRYIPPLVAWQGARISEVVVSNLPRKYGKSKYSIWKMKGFFDLITIKFLTKFSAKPLYFFGSMGFLSSFIGFMICLILLIRKIIGYSIANNMPLLMLGVLLIVIGVQFISLGLIAEMITRSKPEQPVIKRILR